MTKGGADMSDLTPDPTFSGCPNCGLKGGRCCPVEIYFCEETDDYASGFEIECALCDAATDTRPTVESALELWNAGEVISALEQAREERRWIAAARENGLPQPSPRSSVRPTRRKPGEEAPEF
jgi:hypothetical protein